MSERLADRTLDLLKRGYGFSEAWRRQVGDPHARRVPLRMLGKPALLVRGAEGLDLFYDTSKVRRAGAMPLPIRGPLFGKGAVHGLDDEAHRHRKAMFVSVAYDDAHVKRLVPILEREWQATVQQWRQEGGNVYDDAVLAIGRAVMTWAGIAVPRADQERWARHLGQIVDGFGSVSLSHVAAWINRGRCDGWAESLITRTRSGELVPPDGTALAVIAAHRGPGGELLDPQTAGVELQNVIRPTIAVSRFVAFAARAVRENPHWAAEIRAESAEHLVGGRCATAFAEEVRRVYPFVPMLPALARQFITWQDQTIERDSLVLIDIVGTNRDEQRWQEPRVFDPRRFLDRTRQDIEADTRFIPQGGGDVHSGHRCPGEKIAVAVLSGAVSALCQPGIEVAPDGLNFNIRRLPTRPRNAHVVPV